MSIKLYLHILIICGVWFQGFTGIFADEEIRKTSAIHVRQKRVVNRIPGAEHTSTMNMYPYIVRIKENRRVQCVGSILSHRIVITVALCVMYEVAQYRILSGSAQLSRGYENNVTDIRRHRLSRPNRSTDGIALLTVEMPYEYGTYTNRILLNSAPLLPGTLGTISGWGYCSGSNDKGTEIPKSLRTIEVSIMAHRECVNIYQPFNIPISDYDICTYHPQKHCGHTDGGAPLVVRGFLVGLHLWTGPNKASYNPVYPEVFALLQHSEFNQWIRSNIENIEAQFRNHRN